MATGPGARGQGAGLGGGGPRGVRSLLCLQGFPQQWLLRSFLSPPPPPRLSLPPPLADSASEQPARPPQATGPLCWGSVRGRAWHSHSLTHSLTHTHTLTRSARQDPSFSLSLPPPSLSPLALRATLRMRPQGGRRVELLCRPRPLPAIWEEERREGEKEGGREGGREGGGTTEKNKRDQDQRPGVIGLGRGRAGWTGLGGPAAKRTPLAPGVVLRSELGSQSHRQGWKRMLASADSQYLQPTCQSSHKSLFLAPVISA
jgi:hypothetical protein